MGFLSGSVGKNPPANAGEREDTDLISELRSSPGDRNGNPFQCSCRENSVERESWWATYRTWGCKESDTTELLNNNRFFILLALSTNIRVSDLILNLKSIEKSYII